MRRTLLLSLAVLCLGTVGAVGVGAAADGGDTLTQADGSGPVNDSTIRITQEYERIDERGVVALTLRYRIGDDQTRIRTPLTDRMSVVSTDGFSVETENETRWIVWDEETERPTARLHLRVNRLSDRFGKPYAADAANWSIVQTPPISVYWYTYADDVTVDYRQRIDGPGTTGADLLYLGEYTSYDRTVDGQRVRLIVPEDVPLDRPERRLDAVAFATEHLQAGVDADDYTNPYGDTRIDVIVGPPSFQAGKAFTSDAVVSADASTDTWIHETVHMRQFYDDTNATEWLREAAAEYYGYVLTWRHNDSFPYAAVEYQFSRADGDDGVLSRPATWNEESDYDKGAAVVAMLDARIRDQTDGEATFRDVFHRVNEHEGPVDNGTIRAISANVSGQSTAEYFSSYVYGRAVPETDGYAASLDLNTSLSVTATATNGTTGRVELTIRNEGTDPAPAISIGANDTEARRVAAFGRDIAAEPVEPGDLQPNQTETVNVTLRAEAGAYHEERVRFRVTDASGSEAVVTVPVAYGEEPTPTPTATPTPTPTGTDASTGTGADPSTDPSSDGGSATSADGPGFGVALTLIAVALVAVLRRRA